MPPKSHAKTKRTREKLSFQSPPSKTDEFQSSDEGELELLLSTGESPLKKQRPNREECGSVVVDDANEYGKVESDVDDEDSIEEYAGNTKRSSRYFSQDEFALVQQEEAQTEEEEYTEEVARDALVSELDDRDQELNKIIGTISMVDDVINPLLFSMMGEDTQDNGGYYPLFLVPEPEEDNRFDYTKQVDDLLAQELDGDSLSEKLLDFADNVLGVFAYAGDELLTNAAIKHRNISDYVEGSKSISQDTFHLLNERLKSRQECLFDSLSSQVKNSQAELHKENSDKKCIEEMIRAIFDEAVRYKKIYSSVNLINGSGSFEYNRALLRIVRSRHLAFQLLLSKAVQLYKTVDRSFDMMENKLNLPVREYFEICADFYGELKSRREVLLLTLYKESFESKVLDVLDRNMGGVSVPSIQVQGTPGSEDSIFDRLKDAFQEQINYIEDFDLEDFEDKKIHCRSGAMLTFVELQAELNASLKNMMRITEVDTKAVEDQVSHRGHILEEHKQEQKQEQEQEQGLLSYFSSFFGQGSQEQRASSSHDISLPSDRGDFVIQNANESGRLKGLLGQMLAFLMNPKFQFYLERNVNSGEYVFDIHAVLLKFQYKIYHNMMSPLIDAIHHYRQLNPYFDEFCQGIERVESDGTETANREGAKRFWETFVAVRSDLTMFLDELDRCKERLSLVSLKPDQQNNEPSSYVARLT